ncbi:hypothetical protein D3C79_620410 [compost metagenome]
MTAPPQKPLDSIGPGQAHQPLQRLRINHPGALLQMQNAFQRAGSVTDGSRHQIQLRQHQRTLAGRQADQQVQRLAVAFG